jgi:hypothetical protein
MQDSPTSDRATSSEGENVSEIEVLASKAAQLSASGDFWNKAMIWGLAAAAIAAVFIVVTTRLSIIRTSQAVEAQSELAKAKDRQLQLDLKSKDEKIAALDLAATNAKSGLATLQRSASDAKAAQQRVETELTKQKERTAKAERAASDAALALAQFKAPRSLSPEQQNMLVASVKPFAGQDFAFAVFPDPEPQALTRVIDELLKSAGWKRVPAQIQREGGILMDIAGESAAQISDSGVDAYIAPDGAESEHAQAAICSALTTVLEFRANAIARRS